MEWYIKLLLIYLLIINIIGIIITIYDKWASKTSNRRIPEKTLMLFSGIGSGLSIYITMLFIHHKTKHPKFMVGIPVILVCEFVIIIAALLLVNSYV